MKYLVTEKLMALVQESLDDILRPSYNNARSEIRLVVNNVLEQVRLDLLRKAVLCEMLDAYIAKFIDTDAAADRLWKKLLTSSSFMVPIATFVRLKRLRRCRPSSRPRSRIVMPTVNCGPIKNNHARG